ncbi:S26 family signal peptidase [Cryptosporangium arvum]|uniref:Putative transcriptional regulator n=1 Tax=Cryptosporangium arvum DSM 44712 TaxID=927661 RepID=A0A011ALI2_9ACTN|nr:S26 family signal peptidase [Cryptosporangium arvum]EXG82761.1 putative transcriptional regulator [Cryptosporangium arvum DSM 44712]
MSAALVALVTAGVAIGLAAYWARRRYVVVTVLGESMVPTFAHGDRVLVRRAPLARTRTGQVVVAAWGTPVPGGPRPLVIEEPVAGEPPTIDPWVVKRMVAGPGDPVPETIGAKVADLQVPPGRFLLLGDNVAASADSRQFGYVHAEYLLGVVVSRL